MHLLSKKHFTLDKTLPGPDHAMSLEPAELTAMVTGIREVEQALGDGKKIPTKSELDNSSAVKKSLVAAQAIQQGEAFTELNVSVKRPGTGIEPFEFWSYLGKRSKRSYAKDDLL